MKRQNRLLSLMTSAPERVDQKLRELRPEHGPRNLHAIFTSVRIFTCMTLHDPIFTPAASPASATTSGMRSTKLATPQDCVSPIHFHYV